MAGQDGIQWGSASLTVAEGATQTLSYSIGMGSFTSDDLNAFLDGYAIATVSAGTETVSFYGVTAGSITIPKNTTIGSGVTAGALTITVSSVSDSTFLNRHGFAKVWRNIDNLKQDKLSAGTGISISNNTISASGFTKIITVSSLPSSGIDNNAIYVVVPTS